MEKIEKKLSIPAQPRQTKKAWQEEREYVCPLDDHDEGGGGQEEVTVSSLSCISWINFSLGY